MLTRHLGTRASALLDGQLPDEEARRAWEHVETCATCHEEIERERWVKNRLACLSSVFTCAPDQLKGSLLGVTPVADDPSEQHDDPLIAAYLVYAAGPHHQRGRLRRTAGLAAMGGGAVGAAVMGVVALAVPPASAPTTTPNPQIAAQTSESSMAPSNGWAATNSLVVSYMRSMNVSSMDASTRH
jgi:hypothetical protein